MPLALTLYAWPAVAADPRRERGVLSAGFEGACPRDGTLVRTLGPAATEDLRWRIAMGTAQQHHATEAAQEAIAMPADMPRSSRHSIAVRREAPSSSAPSPPATPSAMRIGNEATSSWRVTARVESRTFTTAIPRCT